MSDGSAGGLFAGVVGRGPAAGAVTDAAWLRALLDVEAALARAEAGAGVITTAAADAVADACRVITLDPAVLGAEAAATGTPVVPLVAALRGRLDGPAATAVHFGATSQDVMDTAAMLVAARAVDALLVDLDAAADAAAELAERGRGAIMAARTLLQQAAPTTFGAKAAGWLAGLDAAAAGLARVRRERLAVQLGGAAGTLAVLGPAGPRVIVGLAAELGLAAPDAPWHTERSRIADLAGALGTAAAAAAKPALDIVLLAQTEVAEVHDTTAGRGGSSAMPHKRNPVAAMSARASAMQAPGLVSTLLACAAAGEHERAAGAWQAEWVALTLLLRSVGSAVAWLRDGLEHLAFDPERMRANLDASGGAVMAEQVAVALAPMLGRAAADREVGAAAAEARASGRTLAEALGDREAVRAHLPAAQIAALLDPAMALGSADVFIDRTLAAHAARTPRAHDRAAATPAGTVPAATGPSAGTAVGPSRPVVRVPR